MSWQAVAWVMQNSKAKHSDRLVLLAIAEEVRVKQHGGWCWPAIATIAKHAGLSERAVQYSLPELVSLGELCIEKNGSRHSVNRYRLPKMGCKVCTGGVQKSVPVFAPQPEVQPENYKTSPLPSHSAQTEPQNQKRQDGKAKAKPSEKPKAKPKAKPPIEVLVRVPGGFVRVVRPANRRLWTQPEKSALAGSLPQAYVEFFESEKGFLAEFEPQEIDSAPPAESDMQQRLRELRDDWNVKRKAGEIPKSLGVTEYRQNILAQEAKQKGAA